MQMTLLKYNNWTVRDSRWCTTDCFWATSWQWDINNGIPQSRPQSTLQWWWPCWFRSEWGRWNQTTDGSRTSRCVHGICFLKPIREQLGLIPLSYFRSKNEIRKRIPALFHRYSSSHHKRYVYTCTDINPIDRTVLRVQLELLLNNNNLL